MNKITVAIPTYNRDDYLSQAIASVLKQNDVEFELLILDTASPSNVKDVVDSFSDARIRYVYHPVNLGDIGAANKCIELCQTEFLMILPDDDRLLKGCLKTLYDRIANDPQVGVAIGSVSNIDDTGEVIGEELTNTTCLDGVSFYKQYLTGKIAVQTCAALIRMTALNKVGQFDSHLKYCPDTDLWLRIALNEKISLVSDLVAEYRAHSGTTTAKLRAKAEIGRYYRDLLKKQYKLAKSANIFQKDELEEIFRIATGMYAGSCTAFGLDCLKTGQGDKARKSFAAARQMTPDLIGKLYLSVLMVASFGGQSAYGYMQKLKRIIQG